MAEFAFSPRFLQDLAEWEQAASGKAKEALDKILVAIVQNPALTGRVPSFYDPLVPGYLYRARAVLIHYRVIDDQVKFLNLFYQKA